VITRDVKGTLVPQYRLLCNL